MGCYGLFFRGTPSTYFLLQMINQKLGKWQSTRMLSHMCPAGAKELRGKHQLKETVGGWHKNNLSLSLSGLLSITHTVYCTPHYLSRCLLSYSPPKWPLAFTILTLDHKYCA